MSRLDDLGRFYEHLARLEARIGGARCLAQCHGRMQWPTHGVYFFFEAGEHRSTSGSGPRVVRVGTHALRSTSRTTLWHRLAQHRGVAKTGGGNHRGSIFRLLVGEALVRRDKLRVDTWDRDAGDVDGLSSTALRAQEHPVEVVVSQYIGAMPFVWIEVNDPPGPASARGLIERNAIALLSNCAKPDIDPASPQWLGLNSNRTLVRSSGLWNSDHVQEAYDPAFLDVLANAVSATKPLSQ